MKRLLMITYPFPPNVSAGALRSERFARYLKEFGWSIDIVTIKPLKNTIRDWMPLNNYGEHIQIHRTSTLDPWLWLKDRKFRYSSLNLPRSILMRLFLFPDHMLLWVPIAINAGLKMIKKKDMDAIYTTSPPHSTHLAGLVLSKISGKPLVADFRDPWTLNPFREKDLLDKYFLKLEIQMERMVLRRSSIILVNTIANRNNLLKGFPALNPEKVVYLPNGWQEFPKFVKPNDRKEVLRIVHAGMFYPVFKPYALLHALSVWRSGERNSDVPPYNHNIQVILLGANDPTTRGLVQSLALDDFVEIKPWLPLKEARKYMQSADILWASLGSGKKSATFIPSKLFEYFAARRPIFGFFPEGEASSLIRETNTGIVFTSDEPTRIIHAINKLLKQKQNGSIPYSPNEKMLNKYHIKNIVSKLSSKLSSLQ